MPRYWVSMTDTLYEQGDTIAALDAEPVQAFLDRLARLLLDAEDLTNAGVYTNAADGKMILSGVVVAASRGDAVILAEARFHKAVDGAGALPDFDGRHWRVKQLLEQGKSSVVLLAA